ncbi:hypothetical protein G6F40_014090 [Rhizopus arrhizus]|nr:hypothetical protein G6F40_014090 [Rhizopus arrhizus]
MLERQQLNVLHVVSAEEAFTLLTAESLGRSRHRLDLVLTDVTLKAPPAGAGDDRRRQSPQPDRAAAGRRQRPGAQADRRTAAGYQGAVPAAAGPIERWTPDSMMDEVADTPTIQLEPSWKQHVAQGEWCRGIPARPADLRCVRRHAVRAGEGGHPRPGPVSRPWPGPWPELLGAAGRAGAAVAAEHLQGDRERSRYPASGPRLPDPVGAARRVAAQCGADRG